MGQKKLKDPEILDSAIQDVFAKYRERSRDRGMKFSIPFEKFKEMIFLPCHYCGVEAAMKTVYAREWEYYRNTIDRIDSQKGYMLDNCVPCCLVCNNRKGDEDVLQWLRWVHLVAEKTKDYPGLQDSPPFDHRKANGKIQLRNAQKDYVKYLAYARRGEVV